MVMASVLFEIPGDAEWSYLLFITRGARPGTGVNANEVC